MLIKKLIIIAWKANVKTNVFLTSNQARVRAEVLTVMTISLCFDNVRGLSLLYSQEISFENQN